MRWDEIINCLINNSIYRFHQTLSVPPIYILYPFGKLFRLTPSDGSIRSWRNRLLSLWRQTSRQLYRGEDLWLTNCLFYNSRNFIHKETGYTHKYLYLAFRDVRFINLNLPQHPLITLSDIQKSRWTTIFVYHQIKTGTLDVKEVQMVLWYWYHYSNKGRVHTNL